MMAEPPERETTEPQATEHGTPEKKWLWVGGLGIAVTALCCSTPILVIALSAVGLAGIGAYLDWVLIPLLLFFVVVFATAWIRTRARRSGGGGPAAGSA